MEFNDLETHVKKILKGLVEFYLESGYTSDAYNDPEKGGIYEHKLAHKLGYKLAPNDFPPPEFIAAAQILEAREFVKRMKRQPDYPILGIWPTPKGISEYQRLLEPNNAEEQSVASVDNTRVFVVHGRNEELRKSMFDFLRSIGLKPIEWSQAIQMTGETAPFIGDILDAAFLQAQAVVVLLNGDDEVRLRPEYYSENMPDYEKNLTPQARPNVLFEAGLALGRFPKRTIIVEVGDLRPFSDIAGRHTIRMNNSTKARQDLAQRLSLAGCIIDLSGTDWHESGNFEVSKNVIPSQDSLHSKTETILSPKKQVPLRDEQVTIMQFLASNYSSMLSDVREATGFKMLLIEHFVDDLEARGFVEIRLFSELKLKSYQLSRMGIDWLLENNLMN